MRFKKFIAGLLAATSLVSLFAVNVMADEVKLESVKIDSYHFSDAEFRTFVSGYDTNKDGTLSALENSKITSIDFNDNKKIESLDGIKYLNCLESIKISRTNIARLELGGAKNLKYIEAQKTPLRTINISECTGLVHLDLYATSLSGVDISNNTSLIYLDIVETNITTINLIHNSELKKTINTVTPYEKTWISKPSLCYGKYGYTNDAVFVGYNKDCTVYTSCPDGWIDLRDVSVIPNSSLQESLKTDDSNNDGLLSPSEIENVYLLSIDNLTSIEVLNKFPNLRDLNIWNPITTSLDFSICPNLEKLSIHVSRSVDSPLASIDLSKNTNLRELELVGIKKMTSVDLTNNIQLRSLDIDISSLTSLNLSKNTNLLYLEVTEKGTLTTIDLKNNTKLLELDIEESSITSLDLSNNSRLESLDVSYTDMTELDISNNTDLYELYIERSNIKEVNISNNSYLLDVFENGQVDIDHYPEFDFIEMNLRDRYLGETITIRYTSNTTISTEKPAATPTPAPTTKPDAKPTAVPTAKPGSATVAPTKAPATPTKVPGATSAPKPTTAPGAKPTTTPSNPSVPSDNGVGGFIDRLYTVALGRDFDEGGKNYWTNEIKVNGQTGADIARQFLYSEEFLGKNMSQDDFLTVLYRTFFDREPDASGLKYWKDQMSAGQTKEWVIAGFINSEEWANICLSFGIRSGSSVAPTITITPNENVIGFATRLYTTCLKRDFDPEGLDFWAKELANLRRTGSEAAKGFFFSEEIAKSGISDSEFLTRLYKTLMNREPEKEGFDYWLGQMKSGAMSRESVFDGFAASEEWVGICADYGILR